MWRVLTAFAVFVVACGVLEEPGIPVARVGEKTLTLEQVTRWLVSPDSSGSTARLAAVKDWVNQEILYQEALRHSLHEDPEIAWLLEDARRKILVSALTERLMRDIADPDEGQLEAYYAKHGSEFALPVSHYQVSWRRLASWKEAWDAYKNGSAGEWKQLDWRSAGDMDSCLSGAGVDKWKTGVVNPPIACGDSVILTRLDAWRPAGDRMTFEEARPAVLKAVRRQLRESKLDSVLKDAKTRYPVFTWPENISRELADEK